jgi:hypothetical protein
MITVQASVIGIARAATRAATPMDALEQMPHASDKNADVNRDAGRARTVSRVAESAP